jgi:hypothetical protein
MIFKKPVSFQLFIAGLCLVPFCFIFILLVDLVSLLAVIGVFAGMFYKYKEQEPKKFNRIGWIGNLLLFLIVNIGFFLYFVTHIV